MDGEKEGKVEREGEKEEKEERLKRAMTMAGAWQPGASTRAWGHVRVFALGPNRETPGNLHTSSVPQTLLLLDTKTPSSLTMVQIEEFAVEQVRCLQPHLTYVCLPAQLNV